MLAGIKLFNYKYVHIVKPNLLYLNKDFFFSFFLSMLHFRCIIRSCYDSATRDRPVQAAHLSTDAYATAVHPVLFIYVFHFII